MLSDYVLPHPTLSTGQMNRFATSGGRAIFLLNRQFSVLRH
jgi:hypothetical protein